VWKGVSVGAAIDKTLIEERTETIFRRENVRKFVQHTSCSVDFTKQTSNESEKAKALIVVVITCKDSRPTALCDEVISMHSLS